MSSNERLGSMLTVREVSHLLGIHANTLRRWSNQGKIRALRITERGDRRFKREEIERFIAEMDSQI